ncbi:MAG: energy transducer TonB [Flavobacteriaceae bacterium]|nr:energy transducer TonB [Bacteroidia bacterium]NNL61148.1 energy transducer TonB [Flavobacteriaceae bacterium]
MSRNKKDPQLDVGRDSSLYFSLGLCLMLFITWKSMEHKTYDKAEMAYEAIDMSQDLEDDIPITNLTAPPPPPPPPAASPEVITIVEDIEDIEESVIESTETNQEEAIEEEIVDVDDVDVEEVDEDIDVPFSVVESVPIYPGCKGNNAQLKKCFQTKIQEHINKNFTYPKTAQELGMQGKVFVVFTVDKKGFVTKIRTRGPDKILEKEASRIFELLPQMTPGRQRGRAVNVPYSIPVIFKIIT